MIAAPAAVFIVVYLTAGFTPAVLATAVAAMLCVMWAGKP